MTSYTNLTAFAVCCSLVGAVALPASAQVTTATVAGTVRDTQGAILPGATVTLISETRGTTLSATVTNASGGFVFPNIPGDTYTVQVALEGFSTLQREGVTVSPGDRVAVPDLMLEIGGLYDTVEVRAQVPLIQAHSGERSSTITTTSIENLPQSNRNYALLAGLAPGVGTGRNYTGVGGPHRLGGGGQNNFMIDGISTMDTGNNGNLLTLNIEAVAEVKVLTQAYQAEYGRSSGLQITAVTKGGTNRLRGSLYDIERNSDWNSNSWANIKNGDPKPVSKQRDWGYSVGGPVGKPGGANKLFFFYSHEYRPRTMGGQISRFRVPTELERQGDFSQTRDNQGSVFNLIRDHTTGLPCSASNRSGCFQADGVLGRIPENRLDPTGMKLLNNIWPLPNLEQVPGQAYNYEVTRPVVDSLVHQAVTRFDYQVSPALRVTGRYAGQLQPRFVNPGTLPGYNDAANWHPNRHTMAATGNYTINSTTFVEGTYGFGRNQLGTLVVTPESNRANIGLADFPLLYPDAGVMDPSYYAGKIFANANAPWFQDGRMWYLPEFSWGNRIANAPPNITFPTTNINRSQDFAVSLTKLMGRHTVKVGYYWNHAYKAQNPGPPVAPFAGALSFANDTNNPLDSGFGYANAALGSFSQFQQQSRFVEGGFVYNNHEWYVQDTWKPTPKLTFDYGLRLVYLQPTYDERMQTSNFYLDRWDAAQAPALYVAGCAAASPCSGTNRQAMNPLTGELLGPGSTVAIGQIVPNSGNVTNGLVQSGQGVSKYNYTWPTVVTAPRFGIAYDLTGNQQFVLRGGIGLFHDRPAGDTMYRQVANPPFSTSKTVRYSQLQDLEGGLETQGPPQLTTNWPQRSNIPSSTQWNAGVQMVLPWLSSVDVSYVGQRGFNRLANDRALAQVDINAPDLGAAFLPENQDPTLPPSTVPGARAVQTELLRPLQGFGQIGLNLPVFWDEYHSVQTSFNRRFQDGISFGVNYTLGLSYTGNRNGQLRLDHLPDGSYHIRDDQGVYEELNKNLGNRRHVVKAHFVWELPGLRSAPNVPTKLVAALVNDWRLSGILTAGSADTYSINFSYQSGGSNVNLTGSPSYPARVVITGDPGKGCSSNQYGQFNTGAFSGPVAPSLGLESGREYMVGCPDRTLDLAIARNFRLGSRRQLQARVEMFNALNTVVFSNRVTTLQLDNPTDQTVRNSQFLADGSVDPARLLPRNAGFGAATGAQPMRSIQVQLRFTF